MQGRCTGPRDHGLTGFASLASGYGLIGLAYQTDRHTNLIEKLTLIDKVVLR
jgi:hypothetical protein